ncbi:MAG: enoyl-CoA hydratase/isomerase family protein [Alphaproteobacteria bacterium]|jgi:enoyl-CoA hydratase/carnithine racemase|nr:enoyl-CoA hydratase/isomerase family protein [Alphaproteobacteria bacterium]
MAEYQFVQLQVVNRVGWLNYAKPPINAFNRQMVEEVHLGLKQYMADGEVRVIVLASALERFFSAGADIAGFQDIGEAGMRDWVQLVHGVARTLRHSGKPLLAAINGTAVGGGLEMTLHCDLRFAATDARLGQPEIAINFIPPIGATQALARLIGRPRAIRMLYDGALLPAQEAFEIGLVDSLVAPDELRAEVQAYGEELASKPPEALAAIRQSVTLGGGMNFEDGLAMEADFVSSLAGTDNFNEGVSAFIEKRAPQWKD